MKNPDIALPSPQQAAAMIALASDATFQAAAVSLSNKPAEWPNVIGNPRKWVEAQGVTVPGGVEVQFVNEVSGPRPLLNEGLGMPGPDWVPVRIRQFNCKTYWVRTRGDGPRRFEQVTICFGFVIEPTPVPGGPIG